MVLRLAILCFLKNGKPHIIQSKLKFVVRTTYKNLGFDFNLTKPSVLSYSFKKFFYF